jgi:hypothetical protein
MGNAGDVDGCGFQKRTVLLCWRQRSARTPDPDAILFDVQRLRQRNAGSMMGGRCVECSVDTMSPERQCSLRTIVCRTLLVNLAGNERRRNPAELILLHRGYCKICLSCKHMQRMVHGV